MSSDKPVIVIVPGSCHTPEHYAGLCKELEAKGYPTISSEPPSIFLKDVTDVTVDTDIDFYRNHVLIPLLDDGKEIVVVGHSYGATYGGGAIQGLSKKERAQVGAKGGVYAFIYAASFCAEPGQSALDALAVNLGNPPAWVCPGNKPGTVMVTDSSYLWPNLPALEADKWMSLLKPSAAGASTTPISYVPFRDPFYYGQVAFIQLEHDRIVLPDMSHGYLEKSGITLVASVPGPHGIGVEVNREVADALDELIKKMMENT